MAGSGPLVDLVAVRSKGGERTHLTVAAGGDVQTLCGLTFKAGAYTVAEGPSDCRTCLRRQGDPARISSALFASDQGARLLELSLERARERREAGPRPAPAEPRPRFRVVNREPPAEPEPEPEAEPERLGELEPRGFRRFSENTYASPAGVIVRVSGERVAEVSFEGPAQLVRRAGGALALLVGDVEIAYSAAGGSLRGMVRLRR